MTSSLTTMIRKRNNINVNHISQSRLEIVEKYAINQVSNSFILGA